MNNVSVGSLQGLLLLLIDIFDDFANKNEQFYNPSIKKILITINGMPHELFATGLKARGIYPELNKYFSKENSNVTREEFLTTKFGLWIDTRSSTNNVLHGSGMTVEKSGILLQTEKHLKPVVVIFWVMYLALKMQRLAPVSPISTMF